MPPTKRPSDPRRDSRPESRAAQLYATSPDPVLLLDPDGRITYANPAAMALGELSDRPFMEVLDPFSCPKADRMLSLVASHGFASGWELNLGLGYPRLVTATALSVPESQGYVLLILRDASRPVLTAQRLIEANAAMDEQNRRLSTLLDSQTQELAALQRQPTGRITLDSMARELLSDREIQVLALMAEGLSNQDIAERLIISLATVKTHVRHILQRLGVDDRAQAVIQALHRGLIRLE